MWLARTQILPNAWQSDLRFNSERAEDPFVANSRQFKERGVLESPRR